MVLSNQQRQMKNAEISKILKEANNNNIYLWDLPRPKWTQEDFNLLDAIKNGAKYKTKKVIVDELGLSDKSLKMQQEQSHRMKPIRRKSDGKVFSGMIQLCRETGINRSSLSLALNNKPNGLQKYKDEYEFINK